MKIQVVIADELYQADLANQHSIAIAVMFNGEQPNHFGVPIATAAAVEGGGFIGDTRRGGSCNVDAIAFIPHCNGTHTECIGHIIDERQSVHQQLTDSLMAAQLITVSPTIVSGPSDSYDPPLDHGDAVIDRASLEAALNDVSEPYLTALVVRTLPNELDKQHCHYDAFHYPPFFSRDAISYLNQRGVKHLLVDFPSIDRMYDQGKLSNHHLFWQVEPLSRQIGEHSQTFKTITEMVYVANIISDGLYLLNLQIAPFELDAAPSRPLLIPLDKINA